MKIIHLGNVPVPQTHPEWAKVSATQHPGRWVLNHALAQKSIGLDVEIISQAHKASCDFTIDINGIPIHYLRTFHPYRHLTFYAMDQLRMARLIRSISPDLVHAHGTEAAYGWAAQHCGLPYCITAQGLFFQILPTLGRRPTLNEIFLQKGEDIVWRHAHFAIAKSKYVQEALQKQYPNLDLTLIPNTYQSELEQPICPNKKKELAFIGTLDERKGLIYLAKAIQEISAHVPNLVLHIVGNPPEGSAEGYARNCLQMLRNSLGSRLILHGKIPSRELFSVLDGCIAVVAPSLEEMFGNQLIEGLMRGCYGIVSDQTAMAENVRRFGNGSIVPRRDSHAIASKILHIIQSPPSNEMREMTRQKIRDFMSPTIVANRHRSLYERILSASSEP